MAETIGSVELDLQRRITPGMASVALLVVLTALPVLSADCGVLSDLEKIEVGTTRCWPTGWSCCR